MFRSTLHTVGWREWVSLPDFGVDAIKVKVDTGARSSSLHAFGLETFLDEGGTTFVRFEIHPLQRTAHPSLTVSAPLVETRVVRNPGGGGREELRPVVRTTLHMLGESWPIELTLTRRDAMGFRMLLGRQAIRGRCVVDPGRSFLGGRPQRGER